MSRRSSLEDIIIFAMVISVVGYIFCHRSQIDEYIEQCKTYERPISYKSVDIRPGPGVVDIVPTLTLTSTPSSTYTPTLTPTETPTPFIYIIKAGDTLKKISVRYGVTVDAIANINNISDINLIEVGEQLVIPISETPMNSREYVTTEPRSTETLSVLREIPLVTEPISEYVKKRINDATLMVMRDDGYYCSGVHVGEGKVFTAKHCAPDHVNKIEVGHPDYEFFLAERSWISEERDITLLLYDISKGDYGVVEIGDTNKLTFNQLIIATTYQANTLFREGSYRIHFHRARILGYRDNLIYVLGGLDPEQEISTTSGGASGSGLFDYEGRLLGILSGGWDLEDYEDYVKDMVRDFGGQYNPEIARISVYTSVSEYFK